MIPPVIPQFLQSGDEIRIVSPAGRVEGDYLEKTIHSLENLNYRVSLGKYVLDSYHQYAGNDQNRLSDMQNALNDPGVKAIFCARGGYGSIRLIDKLDFNEFIKSPKWLVGFSDLTVFHSCLNGKFNIASIHSPMPVNFDSPYFGSNLGRLKDILNGKTEAMNFSSNPLNREGKATARLVGGNLSILYSLQSTPYELDTRNAILFIEDVGEQLYHLDRMMNNFRLSGKLKYLKGLVAGSFSAMRDKRRPFGKKAEEIVMEYTAGFNYPVIFDFPAGHTDNNAPFVLGSEIELAGGPSGSTIKYTQI